MPKILELWSDEVVSDANVLELASVPVVGGDEGGEYPVVCIVADAWKAPLGGHVGFSPVAKRYG